VSRDYRHQIKTEEAVTAWKASTGLSWYNISGASKVGAFLWRQTKLVFMHSPMNSKQ